MFEHTCPCIWCIWLSGFDLKFKMVWIVFGKKLKMVWNERKENLKIEGFKKV